MSDLGDLLELMFTAHSRVTSVRATLHEWADTALWQESSRRWAEQGTPGSRAVMALEGEDSAAPQTQEHRHRVWHEASGPRWRVEYDGTWGEMLVVLDGAHWWGSDGRGGYVTNIGPDGNIAGEVGGRLPTRFIGLIFDPASLLASTTLEPGGRTEIAGRPAIEATAHWRRGIDLGHIDWPYADELRIAIDPEFGLMLKFEAVLDGEPFIRWVAEQIAFNEALPDEVFAPLPEAHLPEMPRNAPTPEELKRLLDEFRAMGDEEFGDADDA
jgi:hypothetical protein